MSRLLIVLVIAVGLVLAAFGAMLVLLDNPEAYKKRLSETFQAETGFGLEINGSLDWQYFPPVAIGMRNVAVTIPDSPTPLASLDSASIDLKVWPLIFGGSVEISGLSMDGLTINARIDQSGRANWEVQSDTTETSTSDASDENTDTPPGETNLSIDIGGISITNTTVNYVDMTSASDYVIELKSFTTGPLGTGVTTDIEAELEITDNISNLVLSTNVTGKAAINESLDEFLLDALELATIVKQPQSPDLEPKLNLSGKLNTTTQEATLSNSSIELGGMNLNMNLSVTEVFGATKINGTISAPSFDAKNLLVMLDADPGAMENPDALSAVSFDSDISGGLDKLTLNNLKLGLDSSALTGQVTFVLAAVTGVNFDLVIDSINASDYLATTETENTPSAQDTNSDGAGTAGPEIADSEVLPVSTLSELNIDGRFSINTLLYDTWQIGNLKLNVTNQNNTLIVKGLADAYTGTISLDLSSRYSDTQANTSSALKVTGVDIATALEVDAITGTIELDANHRFSGSMMSQITQTLDGKSTFNIANGTLDVSPVKAMAALVDSIQGTQSGLEEWPDLLPFKSLNGEHIFNSGIGKDQTLNAALENMRITGAGGIDYFANSLEYDIEATLLENAGGQFTVNPKLANIKWPLQCKGSLDADPVSLCLPDRNAATKLIANLARQEVERKGRDAINKKIEEQVPDELKDAAKGLLKGLFGN